MYNDPTIIIIIILAVLAGGLVKGTLGFGMPMVALPIIAFIIPPTTAMILLCAPIFLTNFLQIKFRQGVSSYRFLPMFLSLIIGLIIGARLILEIDVNTITQIIAVSIIFAALVNCFGIKIKNTKPLISLKEQIDLMTICFAVDKSVNSNKKIKINYL